jgi:hypothetical protein
MFLDHFDVLMSKIILKKLKKKLYFDVFLNKKHIETVNVTTIPNTPLTLNNTSSTLKTYNLPTEF